MVLYNLGDVAGHSANDRTTIAVDQEDGSPCQGEQKTQGGDEPYGEKHPEGPVRARPCGVQRAGPRIPEGRPVRAASDHVRAAARQV